MTTLGSGIACVGCCLAVAAGAAIGLAAAAAGADRPSPAGRETGTRPTGPIPVEDPSKAFVVLDEAFRKVLRADSAVRRICEGLKFTEGPVWLPDGKCLMFSDIPADTIHRWTLVGGMEVFRKPSHNANGNTVDGRGRLVTCEHGSRTVTRTEPDGKVVTLAATFGGKKLNSPNDVVVKGDGTIWFTDPPYGIQRGQIEQKANHVFRLDPNAAEPVAVAADFDMPNGLAFSPDEKNLYVADSGKPHHIRRFDVRKDNTLEGGAVFVVISPGGPDGIRVDAEGRLFSTSGDGVQVFSPDGKLLGKILTPKPPANCCYGGQNGKTLFITAREAVYAVELAVGGAK